jgi:peptidase A4-like protein
VVTIAFIMALISSAVIFATGPSPVAAAAIAPVTNEPLVAAHGGHALGADNGDAPTTTSDNWAGYVQWAPTTGTFTEVTDTFVVPSAVSPSATTQYATDWVGIGGFDNQTHSPNISNLVQAGVQTVVTTSNGQSMVTHDAFTESLPHPERPLSMKVSTGDTVTMTVQEIAPNRWRMTVDDVTKNRSRSRTAKYRSTGLSAEAIHERPCLQGLGGLGCNDRAQLAQTSPVVFDPGYFSMTSPGATPVLDPLLGTVPQSALVAVKMLADDNTTVIAVPSDSNAGNDGFAVGDGNTPPPPPSF